MGCLASKTDVKQEATAAEPAAEATEPAAEPAAEEAAPELFRHLSPMLL